MYQTWLALPPPPGSVDIDGPVVAHDQVIGANALGEDRRLAAGVIRQDLARTGGGREEPAIGPERLAIGALGFGDKQANLAVEPDLVGLAIRNVVEEDLALGVGERALQ